MLNKLNPDGSINLGGKNNVLVSPYSNNFYEEIEEGIVETVKILLSKGYLTVSSCDGFHDFNETAHVSVLVNSEENVYLLMFNLKQLGINSTADLSFEHLGLGTVNKVFVRNYDEYYAVKIFLYDSCFLFAPFKKSIIEKNNRSLMRLSEYIE